MRSSGSLSPLVNAKSFMEKSPVAGITPPIGCCAAPGGAAGAGGATGLGAAGAGAGVVGGGGFGSSEDFRHATSNARTTRRFMAPALAEPPPYRLVM